MLHIKNTGGKQTLLVARIPEFSPPHVTTLGSHLSLNL